MKDGTFREDLLYRINTIHLHLPALRERPDDIPVLARHFLNIFARKYNKPAIDPSDSLVKKLRQLSWPGNIRELEHAMEKMIILSENGTPDPEGMPAFTDPFLYEKEPETIGDMERKMIINALSKCGNNLSAAAARLGISRPTLYSKMSKYGI